MTTILIVEDDAGTTELLKEKLKGGGYKTAVVQSADEALAYIEAYSPDLVVLDHDLTDMNNQAFIDELDNAEHFRSIVRTANDAIISEDAQGHVIFWNNAAEAIFGFSAAEMIGQPLTLIVPERFRELHRQGLRRAAAAGELRLSDQTIELVGQSKDGREFPIELSLAGWKSQAGMFFTAIVRDITERKQAEMALQESEAKYRQLFEAESDAIFLIDNETGQIYEVNSAAEKMYGYTHDELLTMQNHDLSVEPDKSRQSMRDRETFVPIRWHRRKDGSLFPVEIRVSYFTWKGRPVRLGSVRDIAARVEAKEAVRESEERYRTLFEQAHDAIHVANEADEIVDVNRRACQLFGYSRQELLTMCVPDLQAPQVRGSVGSVLQSELTLHGNASFESIDMRADGTLIPVEVSVARVPRPGGDLYISIVRDITERKQAEAAQAKLETQLRQSQKMESIGRLAGGVAHDFNNLLTVIRGYSDLMHAQMSREDPLLRDLEQIRLACERAAALTRQLLAFSRQQILAPTILDLNGLVVNLHQMLERLIGEDIRLATVLRPGLWSVTADPGQIEQVIINLVINARDAMPTGGLLTIETGNVHLDDDYASTHPEAPVGPCVMLAVTDTGHGMDEATRARLFEPFFTTKGPGQGTGLGLATAYGIIKQSGGDILVYSEPNRGASFKIYLSANQTAVSSPPVSQPQPVSQRGSETILLVEDEELVRNLVRAALQDKGYTILEAGNGSQALALAASGQEPIDLLLTDVVMPGMSGRELAERLKALRPHLRVLFMSGYTDDAVVRHGVLAAEVEFLTKPFSPSVLAAKVRQVLDK